LHQLTHDVLLQIAQQLLNHELVFIANQGRHVAPTEAVLPFLVRCGFHPRLGTRPMRDAVKKAIGDAVAHNLLTGGNACDRLILDERGEGLCVTTSNDRAELSHSGLRPTDTPIHQRTIRRVFEAFSNFYRSGNITTNRALEVNYLPIGKYISIYGQFA
jgi:hypothetical protein